jgi:hypothetical protein
MEEKKEPQLMLQPWSSLGADDIRTVYHETY